MTQVQFRHLKFSRKNLRDKYCLSPFVQIAIDLKGNVGLCGCEAWMPTMVGNIFQNTIEEILAGPIAQQIRESIIDGSYEYCNENTCGILRNNGLNTFDTLPLKVKSVINDSNKFNLPNEITLAGDLTCNLSCPSCRTKVIKTDDRFRDRQELLGNTLKENLFSVATDESINLTLSTSGELFASPMLLKFVSSITATDFPNLRLSIQTNGLLAPQFWHKLGDMQDRVQKITVTIDAARPETYHALRRGGEWTDLLYAMEWLKNKKQQNSMRLHTRMVVQKDNIDQLNEFYHLSKSFEADIVEYARIGNWGTYTDFDKIDILNPEHPGYTSAKQQLANVLQYADTLSWG